MKQRITDKVTFACQSCGSHSLLSDGAVKTSEDKIYFVFICEDCKEAVPINVDSATIELYSSLMVPGTNSVN